MCKSHSSIALLQEVHYDSQIRTCTGFSNSVATYAFHKAPRAAVVYSKSISHNILPLPEFTNRDMASILINNPNYKNTKIILCSLYWSHDSPDIPPALQALASYATNKNIPIILGMDANAHNVIWGSSDTNSRGRTLDDFLTFSNISTVNNSSIPTFQTSSRQEVLDVTAISSRHIHIMKDWKVTQFVSQSDHNLISFNLAMSHKIISSYRILKKTDWVRFYSYLEDRSNQLDDILQLNDMDTRASQLNTLLTDAFKDACPVIFVKRNTANPWWNSDLRHQERNVSTLKRLAYTKKSAATRAASKAAKRRYNKSLTAAKNNWKKRIATNLTSSNFPSYLNSLSKTANSGIPSLLKPDGTYTSDHAETLNAILSCTTTSVPCDPPIKPPLTISPPLSFIPQRDSAVIDKILTQSVIKDIIHHLVDDKAPGSDYIYPIMIKRAWPLIDCIVYSLFRDSLIQSRVPHPWLISRASLIPKTPIPSSSAAFRIINLSCVLLKILEKCIKVHLQEVSEIKHSNIQFGFQPGVSTDAALHALFAKLENAAEQKKLLLAISLDLKSAFDNISFSAIDQALAASSSPPIINSWISHYIRNRYVMFRLGPVETLRLILKGCPQGGILSPFLFNIVVDSLLQYLKTLDPSAVQAYADDLICALSAALSDINSLHAKAQCILDIITSWCTSVGLTINTTKTRVVLFTNIRKAVVIPPLFIYGVPLELSPSLKYLGVTLDSKLTFKSHTDKIIASANSKLGTLSRLIGRSWGLRPSLASWGFTSIIRPATLHGSVIWNKILKKKTYIKRLQKLDNRHLRQVCRSMKSSPPEVNYVLTGVTPLDFEIFSSAIIALYRLSASNLLSTSRSSLALIDELGSLQLPALNNIDLIKSSPNLVRQFTVNVDHNLHDPLLKSSLFDTHTEQHTVNVFTDGSKSPEHCGAGFIFYEFQRDPTHCKISLSKHNSVFQSEIVAISKCAELISAHLTRSLLSTVNIKTVNIFSDSQASLSAICYKSVKTRSTHTCVKALNTLGEICEVNLYWVQAHIGIKGNEAADFLARTPAKDLLEFPNLHFMYVGIPPPLSYVKSLLSDLKRAYVIDKIEISSSSNPLKQYVRSLALSSVLPKWAMNLPFTSLRLLSQCISGHAPLNYFLSKIDPSVSPLCQFCGLEEETNVHFICKCPHFDRVRLKTTGMIHLSILSLQKIDISKIMAYILNSDRFCF